MGSPDRRLADRRQPLSRSLYAELRVLTIEFSLRDVLHILARICLEDSQEHAAGSRTLQALNWQFASRQLAGVEDALARIDLDR